LIQLNFNCCLVVVLDRTGTERIAVALGRFEIFIGEVNNDIVKLPLPADFFP